MQLSRSWAILPQACTVQDTLKQVQDEVPPRTPRTLSLFCVVR